MLKDKEKMIYECDRCKFNGTSKDNTLFCFSQYSANSKNYNKNNLHLCKSCYSEYYEKRDELIDCFLAANESEF